MKLKSTILGLSFALIQQAAQAAPVVYFDFNGDGLQDTTVSVNLGETFNASLYVTNVDNLQGGLLAWGSEVTFNNAVLSANAFTIDSQWPFEGAENTLTNASGGVDLFASRLSGLTGTIKLADISFNALTAGSSFLSMNELFADNINFVGFGSANGFDYETSTEAATGINFSNADATITVSAVPVPPAVILFLSGLLGLVRIKKYTA